MPVIRTVLTIPIQKSTHITWTYMDFSFYNADGFYVLLDGIPQFGKARPGIPWHDASLRIINTRLPCLIERMI